MILVKMDDFDMQMARTSWMEKIYAITNISGHFYFVIVEKEVF